MRGLLRYASLAAGLLVACLCLSASPARAATCQASAALPVTFSIFDVQSAVIYSYGTTVGVSCSGAPGEAVTVCLRPARATTSLVPGISFTFSAGQGSGTVDGSGRLTLSLAITESLSGVLTGDASSTSLTFQQLALDWDGGGYSCSATSRIQGPVQFPVNMVISNVCSISVKQHLTFPNTVSGATGAVTARGVVAATCTKGIAYRIFLSQGNNNAAGLPTTRRMVSRSDATQFLQYGLYSDPSYVSPWGWSGSGLGAPPAQTGNGVEQTLTVYGRIDLTGQSVAPGFYSDMIIVSIAY